MRSLLFVLSTSIVATLWISGSMWSSARETSLSEVADYAYPESSSRFLENMGFLPNDSLLGFVRIKEGDFLMGSDRLIDPLFFDNEIWPNESPKKIRGLPEFYIGRYEVTVGQFNEFLEDTGYLLEISGESFEHPVSEISWPDAIAYTRWIDEKLRTWPGVPTTIRDLLEKGWTITLPSEIQWEKAARGEDGRRYPWGPDPRNDKGNYNGQKSLSVGSFPCGECVYGLFDMSGNVWEWTRSPYRDYPVQASSDQLNLDLAGDALWVMRGGSFADTERYVRSATRGAADPGVRRPFIGFRISLSGFY
ncbi:MAG: hypothetical protein CME30_03805 [Gemmatimonadetes bacterium]|nr:hypothetical protein [Gemmatimonadota bacterium]